MKRILLLTVVALAVGVLAPTVHAGMWLEMKSGLTTVTILDNGFGDNSALAGVINWSGVVGVFNLNVTTGISKPFFPALPPKMDLNSINANSTGAGTLTIRLTDQDFSLPAVPATFTSAWGGTTGGTVSLDQIYDPDNNLWGTGGVTLSSGPFGPGAFSDTVSVGVLGDPLFSLTELAIITHTRGASTSFNAESTVVPVPGAILLGFLGLSAAGVGLRKLS